MENEKKDTLIHGEMEKEVKFSRSFKLVLAISIFLTGIMSFAGISYLVAGISSKMWLEDGINAFLYQSLMCISILLCFIALINIAIVKKPFSKILVWCTMAIGSIFTLAAFIFPRFEGYKCSGFRIISTGKFTLIDGSLLMLGLLGLLFSKVIQYGFAYQIEADMTV